ncbi:hypothetical protein [Flagellimonas eckloniae]|nr:hypothetical protein [Allomuricauda eckloniae]
MLKTIAFPLIAIMLIFSILAPSVLPLLDKDYDMFVFLDNSEEEKSKEKESEKKFDEKDMFYTNSLVSNCDYFQNQSQNYAIYINFSSDFKADILLPPPRKLA